MNYRKHLSFWTFLLASSLMGMAATDEGITVDPGAIKQVTQESPAQREQRMKWWRDAKFGMFIHWGVYSVPAGRYQNRTDHGEWIMKTGNIPVEEYRAYARQFNPSKYDPTLWVKTAKAAGMRYMVITAKHHDGFALFPSSVSDWNVIKASPYGKDLIGPLSAAARQEGLRFGLYYSQSQDWMNPGGAKAGLREGEGWDPAHKGSYDRYLDAVAAPQVKEILNRYEPDVLWWDTPMYMTGKRTAPFEKLVQEHPNLITNNRLGTGGDTQTPEGYIPVSRPEGDWETCMTLNDHWGYNAVDKNWKSAETLIRMLASICSKGGNFLLNVGPTSEGEIPPECVERLQQIGAWIKVNGESIYGTEAGPFNYLSWGAATRKGHRLYLHVFSWPLDGKLRIPLMGGVNSAWLLASPGHKLSLRNEKSRVVISLPKVAPDPFDSVIALDLQGEPAVRPVPSEKKKAVASACRPGDTPGNAVDGSLASTWRAPDKDVSAWLEIDLGEPETIAAMSLGEPDIWPRMKQRYSLQANINGVWETLDEGKTKGHGFQKDLKPVTARLFRLTLQCDKGSPGVSEFQLYRSDEEL